MPLLGGIYIDVSSTSSNKQEIQERKMDLNILHLMVLVLILPSKMVAV